MGSVNAVPEPACESLRERKKRQTRERINAAAIDLVAEKGMSQTTVEEICAAADVSPRTFFNYYPTKAAAILGLPAVSIDPAAEERFRTGAGALVDDTITLVADVASEQVVNKSRTTSLIHSYPELAPTMFQWGNELRDGLLAVVAGRSDDTTARLLLPVIMLAFGIVAPEVGPVGPEQLAHAIRTKLEELSRLLHRELAG